MIFDAGVFIALDNPADRGVVLALLRRMRASDTFPITNEAVLAQAWRNPSTQAVMARIVKTATVYPFGDPKTIGLKCAATGTSDVVDASVAVLADRLGVPVLTTDPDDMAVMGVDYRAL